MRRLVFSVIFVLVISSAILPIFPLLISTTINSDENQGEIGKLNTSALTEINTTIIINDLPGSLTN